MTTFEAGSGPDPEFQAEAEPVFGGPLSSTARLMMAAGACHRGPHEFEADDHHEAQAGVGLKP